MNAAEQLVPIATERPSWAEICAQYLDQFVCLVDIAKVELRSPEIKTACVVGHGPTHECWRSRSRYRAGGRSAGSSRYRGPRAEHGDGDHRNRSMVITQIG
jgi:hypothetical protein